MTHNYRQPDAIYPANKIACRKEVSRFSPNPATSTFLFASLELNPSHCSVPRDHLVQYNLQDEFRCLETHVKKEDVV